MRLAVIAYEDLSRYNGAIVQLVELCENLAALGHSVTLYNPGHGRFPRPVKFKIRYVPVIDLPLLRNLSYLIMSIPCLAAGFLRDRPERAVLSEYYLDPVPALACAVFGVPMTFFVNGIVSEDMTLPSALKPVMWLINLVQKFNCAMSAAVLAITDEVGLDLRERHGFPRECIEVLHDGVDPEKFRPMDSSALRAELGIAAGAPVTGFVGGLFKWHGLDYLVEAVPLVLKELPEARFLIVGGGPLGESLKALAVERGVRDAFIFTGRVPYEEVPRHINVFDLCICFFKGPRKNPGDPVKTYEYLACGKPVLASSVKGYGDFVERVGAGVSVDASDPAQAAAAILKLLKAPALRAELAGRGRLEVEKKHTWLRRAGQMAAFLEKASSRGAAARRGEAS
ncbi:MAG: hypothetical protein A2089_13095 [Elusimicrobia bacterium GWD2_63_28]|nr:MAG: hypothetical protein A2089_13095 [Elusimicrobia bacterium GWD2_63_28]